MRLRSLLIPALLGGITLASTSGSVCSSGQPSNVAPHKNIWQGLTNKEAVDVIKLLHSNATGLNLTIASKAGSWDNKIITVELMLPNKTDVLPFLASNGSTIVRYARAVLMFGATKEPHLREYIIGPLPVTSKSTVQPYTFRSTRGGDGKISVLNADSDAYATFGNGIMADAADVTKFLWNLTAQDGLQVLSETSTPLIVTNGKVLMWQGFVAPPTSIFDTGTLLPLGLYFRTDITGRDPSKYKVTGWVYNNQLYPTLDAFRKATADPGFKKLGKNVDGEWAHTDKHGDPLPFDDLPPPASVQPGQSRFSVDSNENFVTWMDFSFYVATTRDTGLRLFDIHYKGKRILYELGLDEAIAHYAGIDPVHSGICFFDSMYGFGPNMVSLVHGYDCPAYSTFLNATETTGETTHTQKDGICMFEIDKGYPIQRHSWTGYTGVTKNIAFTIRSISTIGNYDYMTSYEFYLDGSIEVSVRASGYISSAFYAANDDYGFKIHDSLSGSLHDHVITFKADFDILGEKNSVQKIEIVPATEKYVWSDGEVRNTMKASRSFVETENDSKINWSPNGGTVYAIVNKDKKNDFGEYPGYRIFPATGATHLTIQNSSVTKNAAHHTTHHLYVTKQKDSEARAVDAYNSMDVVNPPVDFAKYFNGESLVQDDIVVWFNLGMHHMPHTGDLPNTVFTTAHSAITIQPLNYLRGDPSRATSQQVQIHVQNNTATVKHFSKGANCSIDQSQLNPDLSGFTGGISVRKYPFDGTRPDRAD